MTNYEKLGAFYLGRRYDLAAGQPTEDLLLYDSKDLVTHAACFGMTGSGKTGLCAVLLEEAAIDGVPAIVIDPKGDLTNLLLTFPDLQPGDFAPWVPDNVARQKGRSRDELAAQHSQLWRQGLAEWGQTPDRIARLRAAADFAIYTPGSDAGLPVALLRSFDVPSQAVLADRELLRERVHATVTSLLDLIGLKVDPIQSREHVLLSLLLDRSWSEGKNLDLAGLIGQVQNPPLQRVGLFDLETYYPSKERFGLAMTLNNVLASPAFEAWREGEPLDIDRMLHTADGRPRISIFSIAHLGDAERMFFVSALLTQTVSWMRQQPGTTALRALLYMDEVAGYLPPVANPASKPPMMTLLKQARAFGLGVVLATQNPMDLDYKALGNTGTWFIGRLQTDRDQARVLDGLAGAAAGAGTSFDRRSMEQTLAGLGKRVFVMYNVHDDAPETFQTRWALSYLCGPLTRDQIQGLMAPRKASGQRPQALTGQAAPQTAPALEETTKPAERPLLPHEIRQVFVPPRVPRSDDSRLVYHPMILGCARAGFSGQRQKIDHRRDVSFLAPVRNEPVAVDWDRAIAVGLGPSEVEAEPFAQAVYRELVRPATQPKNYADWQKNFVQWLYATQRLTLYHSARWKQSSRPEETERDFHIRLDVLAREERDREMERLNRKYAPKLARLQETIRKTEAVVEREQEQAQHQKLNSAVSIGATLLGALFGRRVMTRSNMGSAGSAVRSMSRASKESSDVARAQDTLQAYRRQLADLETEFQLETGQLESGIDAASEPLDSVEVAPKKTDIAVSLFSLAWLPYWQDRHGVEIPAWESAARI